MAMEIDVRPLIRFDEFAKSLERHGIHVGEAKDTYREISSGEVNIRDIHDGAMTFEDDGIFVNLPDGGRQQVFLYKRSYKIAEYGKPRYHICKCGVIESFMNRNGEIPEYRKSNSMTVKVIDTSDNNTEKDVNNLPLCKYCAKLIGNVDRNMTSNAFVGLLRKAYAQNESRSRYFVDKSGYTENWPLISYAYREKRHFTCENCGVQVGPLESEYMHVHHISGDKTDNRECNLRCLCIKCHSEVDATHVHNFARRSQQLLIAEFMRKYGETRNVK